MTLPVRLIATDIDGTLLSSRGVIPPDNLRAILGAQRSGITVAIASGRFPENAYCLLQSYGLSCPIIGTNGGRIVDENLRLLAEHPMTPQAAMAVQAMLDEAGADYFAFGAKFVCSSNSAMRHHSELSDGEKIMTLGLSYRHGPEAARESCVHDAIYKFFVCNNVPFPPLREALAKIGGISLTQSGPHNIEVMPEHVDKGQGIRELAALLNIPLSQVMTLGDQENDIPMLRAAGYSVAMGNASPETKAAARFVTDTNDQAGFARAIERFALTSAV